MGSEELLSKSVTKISVTKTIPSIRYIKIVISLDPKVEFVP